MESSVDKAQQGNAIQAIKQYFLDFGVLRDNPREYWAIQIVNFLDSAAYFSLIAIVTVFLTSNIGWNDVHAGYIITGFTSLVTISLIFSGFFTDSLGIRRSVLLAIFVQLISRGGLLVLGLWTDAPYRMWLVVLFLVLTAPGLAMTITVFQAANKRFSSRRSRSASFNLWYLIMNLGGVVGGLLIDVVRLRLQIDNSYIFAFGVLSGVLSILTALFLITREHGVEDEPEEPTDSAGNKLPTKSAWEIFTSVVRESAFWRFIVLMVAFLGVRAVFTYMYLLMPKYWIRIIGEDVEMGFLQAVNPILIVVGLILFIPLANKFNVFKMLVFGAIISSFSLIMLVLPWQWFSSDMAVGYFRMSLAMLILLSLGEVIWSPKLNEYTAAIAPTGQEGSYLGMSMMPWFFAKTTVGIMSGHMLVRWCPEGTGQKIAAGGLAFWDSPEAMWLLLFFWAILGPLLAIVFSGWLTKGADLEPASRAGKK